jgi:hypothetical protein
MTRLQRITSGFRLEIGAASGRHERRSGPQFRYIFLCSAPSQLYLSI